MMSYMKVLYVITFGPDFLKAHVARFRFFAGVPRVFGSYAVDLWQVYIWP